MKKGLVCALVLLVMSPIGAAAQDSFWSTTLPAVTGTDTLGLALRSRMEDQRHSTRPRSSESSVLAVKPPTPADFRFTPSRKRREENLARFVAKSRAIDPKGADGLAALFAQGDIIERMRPELAKYGLGVDNVADAYTMWWINAWDASRGLSRPVSHAAAASVRRQVMETMAATPVFRAASDRAKQEMAEALLVQGMLLASAVEQAQGNRALLDQVSRAAVQGARGMSLDLSTMTLTDKGFAIDR